MGKPRISTTGYVASGLILASAVSSSAAFGQIADAPQSTDAIVPLPEMMMEQLREVAQSAAEEVLPINIAVNIGGTGMVFPPLALPSPVDPAYLDGLHQHALGVDAWTGWGDWRENLESVIETDSANSVLVASTFIEATNATITQTVYSTGPDFDLLSIYQTADEPQGNSPSAPDPQDATPEAGFFSQ